MKKDNIVFSIPRKGSMSRFVDNSTKIEFVRTFGIWKCLNCRKRWFSAFTWLSLNFCVENKDLCFDEKKIKEMGCDNVKRFCFDGSRIKIDEILMQYCKTCQNKNNKVMVYSALSAAANDNDGLTTPHRRDLCAKCLSGNPCKKD